MLKRFALSILLVLQALAGGAVSLAHARDVVFAPAGVEASHNARCVILHDEMRCALCHYASSRVVTQQPFTIPASTDVVRFTATQPTAWVAAVTLLTAPARAPPALFS